MTDRRYPTRARTIVSSVADSGSDHAISDRKMTLRSAASETFGKENADSSKRGRENTEPKEPPKRPKKDENAPKDKIEADVAVATSDCANLLDHQDPRFAEIRPKLSAVVQEQPPSAGETSYPCKASTPAGEIGAGAGDGDEDEELPSLRHLWSKQPPAVRFRKGDIVMVKVLRYPRWPYIVSNIKAGRATLYELPRIFPIAKGSKPDITVKAKKLERYRKTFCDMVDNYRSRYSSQFDEASKQADTILNGNLNPFVDHVEVAKDELVAKKIYNGPDPHVGGQMVWRLEASDDEEEDDGDNERQDPAIVKDDAPPAITIEDHTEDNESELPPEALERCEILLTAVMAEDTEAYLANIMQSQVPCERRDKFFELERTGRLQERRKIWGPFEEDAHIDEATDFVCEMRRKYLPKLWNGDAYALSVLFPEAIKFGLQKTWVLGDIEAEKIMNFSTSFYDLELKRKDD